MLLSMYAWAQPVPEGLPIDLADSAEGAILPAVAAAPDGTFVAAWQRYGGTVDGVVARRADSSGKPTGPGLALRKFYTHTDREPPSVAVDPDGNVLVAWSEDRSIWRDILVQPLSPQGHSTVVSQDPVGQPRRPAIAAAGPGRFLVVWTGEEPDVPDVTARWVDAAGRGIGNIFRVNVATGGDTPDVSGDAAGRVIVAWLQWNGVEDRPRARFYAPDGGPSTGEVTIDLPIDAHMLGANLAVATTPDGFLVVWTEERITESIITEQAIVAQPFSSTGAPGQRIRVAELQNSVDRLDVAVSGAGLGLVAWEDRDNGVDVIRAASVDVHSGVASPPVVATVADLGHPYAPALAANAAGDFLLAWTSIANASAYHVLGRVLSLCGNGIPEPGEVCDDGNRVSGDCCSPSCTLEPVDGTCWRLAGTSLLRLSASGTVKGLAVACSARCRAGGEASLILLNDGSYRQPGVIAPCLDGSIRTFPDTVGRQRGARGVVILHPRNLETVRAAIRECTGARLLGDRTVLRVGANGLRGTENTVVRRPTKPPVTIQTTTRLSGVRLDARIRPAAPSFAPSVNECPPRITLRCHLR